MSPGQQGKKGTRAAAAPVAPPPRRRRPVGLVLFGVLFVGLFVGVALAQGLGGTSLPDGAVALIEDAPSGEITQEQFDRALEQTAKRQGLQEVPPPEDQQFELLKQAATSDLILSRWVLGEAEERGIEVTEREIDQELETVKEEQFGSEKAFEDFLEQSGFTLEEALERIELQLISDRIQMAVLPEDPEVSEDEIQTYYDENVAQFEQPETRDVRVILTKDQADADEALAALEQDSTPKGFEEVAKEFSIDEATKATGGLREAVIQGQSEPILDQQIFVAPEGEIVGPFEGDAGFYLIQVDSITAAVTTPLEEASEQIRQTLVAARQQQIATTFQEDFTAKWTARTICADDYAIDRCSNAPALPDPCTEEVATTTGCGAVVPSTKPISPGGAGVFGAPVAPGLPQGPITPAAAVPALPPGLVPGAPGTLPPGGAAPPQAPPPGTAPPQAPPAPPGG